jgi:hypothetical protein
VRYKVDNYFREIENCTYKTHTHTHTQKMNLIIYYLAYFLVLTFDANALLLINTNNNSTSYSELSDTASRINYRDGDIMNSNSSTAGATFNQPPNQDDKDDDSYETILFKSSANNSTLAKCSLQSRQSNFKCDTLSRSLFCKLNVDTSRFLANDTSSVDSFPSLVAKLTEFGQSLVRDEKRHEIPKYGLFPFRLNLLEMAASFAENSTTTGRTIVLDYVIPVYGSWNVLSLYYEKFGEAFRLDFRDVSCFSQLIGLLNESGSPTPLSRRLNKFNKAKA